MLGQLTQIKNLNVEEKQVDISDELTQKERFENALNKIQHQITDIYNSLMGETNYGMGTLVMLSQIELRLEQVNDEVLQLEKTRRLTKTTTQRQFELRAESDRCKLAAQILKDEKEIVFKEKMQRYIEKSKKEIKQTDLRQVRNKVMEKRQLSNYQQKVEEIEDVKHDSFDE